MQASDTMAAERPFRPPRSPRAIFLHVGQMNAICVLQASRSMSADGLTLYVSPYYIHALHRRWTKGRLLLLLLLSPPPPPLPLASVFDDDRWKKRWIQKTTPPSLLSLVIVLNGDWLLLLLLLLLLSHLLLIFVLDTEC